MNDQEKIFNYMKEQNRPYSSTDIYNNLNKEIGKSSILKCLDKLVEEGKLNEKLYGKQKVYLINQDKLSEMNNGDLNLLKNKFGSLQKELKELQAEFTKAESEFKMLTSSMTTEEAKRKLVVMETEIMEKSEKLIKLKQNDNRVSAEERDKILLERTNLIKEWRNRKRMAKDIMDTILENYPKTKKQFLEEVGIELDEDYDVAIPDI